MRLGLAHWITAPLALVVTTLIAGLFGWIALRATGLGFLMITLALSQVLWGTAYRWAAVTNGDNGLSGLTRPAPFGISIDGAGSVLLFFAHRHDSRHLDDGEVRQLAFRRRAARHAGTNRAA